MGDAREAIMAEENAQQSDTLYPTDAIERSRKRQADAGIDRDWRPEDSPSGSDPTIEDDLVAKEKELRTMTREEGDSLDQDAADDEVENPENLLAQAEDPDAQES
jgi:hypothetical protein